MVIILLLTLSSEARAVALDAHILIYCKAFSGNATTSQGYNPAMCYNDNLPAAIALNNSATAPVISGTVWWDQNDSGTMDASELAIPGATIQLYSQSDPNTLLASTQTNYAGQYSFSVNPGNYLLLNATPSSIGQNLTFQANIDPSNPNQYDLILNSGDNVQNLSFGELTFPSQLITKALFLTSTPPLQNVPEPGVWIELLSAGLAGLMYFWCKYKRHVAH